VANWLHAQRSHTLGKRAGTGAYRPTVIKVLSDAAHDLLASAAVATVATLDAMGRPT
jgi:hypothetical protein